jgi:hypothetical protein
MRYRTIAATFLVMVITFSSFKQSAFSEDPEPVRTVMVSGYTSRTIEGWTVQVSDKLMTADPKTTGKAIVMLGNQLKEVKRVVPNEIQGKLVTVPIWLSPPYDGFQPTGEYQRHLAKGKRSSTRAPSMC